LFQLDGALKVQPRVVIDHLVHVFAQYWRRAVPVDRSHGNFAMAIEWGEARTVC
jgi:hypothetical protein